MATARKKPAAKSKALPYTVPGMERGDSTKTVAILQERLDSLNDLALTLKHIHWNVVGPRFIGVHTMLDPQVDAVRLMVDETAERIATLGGEPSGTPGGIVKRRTWDDYSLNRAQVGAHLGALDLVYAGVIEDQREAIEKLGDLDPVSEDMLIGQCAKLEMFHWFVRAHLEDDSGVLTTADAKTEQAAARQSA